jgi:hypothetical protein
VRQRLEHTLDADLSSVRVVDGPDAKAAASALDSSAFTTGDTIVMGEPGSGSDRERLLAHEAAHVVQQRQGRPVPEIGPPADQHERAAARTADAAMSGAAHSADAAPAAGQSVPAVQRQFMGDKLSRAQARERITAYLEREQARQRGQKLRVSPEVKAMISRIFQNDVGRMLQIDSYFSRRTFPGTPAGLAADVARYIPDFIDKKRLAHLEASTGPPPTKLERVKSAVEKTAPYETPEQQESKWEFERAAKEARKGEEAVGPYGVDLARLFNVKREYEASKPPAAATPQARAYGTVETVVATIARDELIPAEAKGKAAADNYADAQEVARGLASDLDIAQQQNQDSIALRLGADYNRVKDRLNIATRVARIAILIRNALPHGASKVSTLELYYGNKLIRRISLAKKAE